MKLKTRNLTQEEQLNLLKNFPKIIPIISNLNEEVMNSLIKKENSFIKYLKNPPIKLQRKVINNNSFNIVYINNPAVEIQIETVKKNYNSIFYIKNPHPELFKVFPQFNFDIPEELLIRSIIKNPNNVKCVLKITPKIENFILNHEIWDKISFPENIKNPTKAIQKK